MSLFRRGGRQGSTGWSSGSGTRATATPGRATTSASRWRSWLAERWGLPQSKKKYGGLYTDGRTGPAARAWRAAAADLHERVGQAVGPARGALGVDLDHVVVVHDEIDLPFGQVEVAHSAAGWRATTG